MRYTDIIGCIAAINCYPTGETFASSGGIAPWSMSLACEKRSGLRLQFLHEWSPLTARGATKRSLHPYHVFHWRLAMWTLKALSRSKSRLLTTEGIFRSGTRFSSISLRRQLWNERRWLAACGVSLGDFVLRDLRPHLLNIHHTCSSMCFMRNTPRSTLAGMSSAASSSTYCWFTWPTISSSDQHSTCHYSKR